VGTVDTSGPWRVKQDGATLPVVMGFEQGAPPDRSRVLATQKVCVAGQVINEPLEEQFVQRWEDGEPHARSLVDRLDEDGNVIGGSASDDDVEVAQANAEAASAEAEVLRSRVEELESELAETKERAEAAEQDLANAQAAAEAQPEDETEGGGEPGGDGQESGSGGGGEQPAYDPNEHNAEDVVEYLRNSDDEEVDRVKKAEEAGKGRSTILNFERSSD
jgi:hypothetical protein